MDFSKWAINNRKLIHFVMGVLTIGGLYAYYDMSKLEDPEIKVKQAMVVTTFPGADSYQVELEVTEPLEKAIRAMPQVEEFESQSMNDLSLIKVTLYATVPDNEVEQAWDMLRRKVESAQAEFPAGVSHSIVKDDFGDVYGMFYAITSDGFSDGELNDYAELVRRELQKIEGVSKIDIYGKRKECIYIELNQDRMAALGVHPAEILSTFTGQNETVYTGYYESAGNRIRVDVSDRYNNADDIRNLLLQGHEGDQIHLGDAASVSMGWEDPVRNSMKYDGRRALGISIAVHGDADITKVGRQVEKTINNLQKTRIPIGVEFNKVFFQPERVKEALDTFLVNLIESIVIVVFILMLTMGFTSGAIIGVSLLLIVLGSFLVLNYLGGTLQRVSLGAFIVAMGMLVDNAIVIIDGILLDMQRGLPREESLTAIGRKTAMPLLGATIIAILAFFPIFLSPDTTGDYVRDLFIVLGISLLLSWILALTQVPIHAKRYIHPKAGNGEENMFSGKAYRILQKILHWCLLHRTGTISIAAVLVLVSVYCYRFLPQVFFPDMNYNQLYIEYNLPENVNSSRVEADLDQIREYLLSREDITHVTTSVGGTPSRYNLVRSIATPALSYGELIVDFTSPKVLVENKEEIQKYLMDNYPQSYVRLKRYNLMYEKFPVAVQFTGPDPAVLKQLTSQAEKIMEDSPNIRLIRNDWPEKVPSILVRYDQPTARRLGLTRSDVSMSLLSIAGGIPIGNYFEGAENRTIYMKCVDNEGNPIESLENAPIFGMMPPLQNLNKQTVTRLLTGSKDIKDIIEGIMRTIPLSQITDGISFRWDDPLVIRYNGERAMTVQCEPVAGVSAESARQSILSQIESIELPEGYNLEWKGEYKASTKSTKYLFKNFPLAIILMIFILILLFKDFKRPIIIFCCIPLVFIGVVGAVLLSGKSFGFVAIVGVLGLIGMVIKTAIVLMDEIDLQLSLGKDPTEALLYSSASRFRPVMMASLTTVLGMLPLISDDMFGSLAVTIMGGLFVGTVITLLFIPVLYSVFFRYKIKKDL